MAKPAADLRSNRAAVQATNDDASTSKLIERLELFDEFEEWYMMQEHYCVAYAINDELGLFENFGFPVNKDESKADASENTIL